MPLVPAEVKSTKTRNGGKMIGRMKDVLKQCCVASCVIWCGVVCFVVQHLLDFVCACMHVCVCGVWGV